MELDKICVWRSLGLENYLFKLTIWNKLISVIKTVNSALSFLYDSVLSVLKKLKAIKQIKTTNKKNIRIVPLITI